MAAFGTMPVGTGPFGVGTPTAAAVPPTGSAGSRYINPASRDYEQDPTTLQLAQMPALRQRVLIALTTIKTSSSALPDFGIVLPPKVTPSYESEIKASVRSSLARLTDVERVMRIDGMTVEIGASGRQRVTVQYTDISTGVSESVTT